MENDKKVGRPLLHAIQDSPMDAYNVRITAWHARKARKLGDGNLALGVRKAIEMAEEKKPPIQDDC